MSVQIIRYKDHAEWLNGRQGGIGSSEVGTILGCNPWETPYQLWRRKKGLDAPKSENFVMKAGHYLEDAVSKFYEDETGAQIIKRSADEFLIVNDAKPYLRVSPDRTFWLPNLPHNNENKAICECKTTQMSVDADNVPQHWFVQLQYQMGVAEMQHGALAWLTQGREFGYQNYEFDSEFYEWMLTELDRFWTDYIVGDKVPDSANVEDVMIRSPRSVAGKIVDADEDIASLVAELKEAKLTADVASGKVDELTEKIKLYMGDAETLNYNGIVLATWKSNKDSVKFDAKRYQAEHADACKSYIITTPGQRRFILK